MVVKCEIEFEDNPSGVYFNGQLVSGTITLRVPKKREIKGIVLKIQGFSVTQWREKKLNRHQFAGREDYIAFSSYLLGSEEALNQFLHAGIHHHPFSCQLPSNCPSSFEGRYGYIRYLIKVALITKDGKTEMVCTRGFTVIKLMDLNSDLMALRVSPSSSESYKTFCCGPCTTEPMKLELSVPQIGFVPGQNIAVTLLVINNTKIAVADVSFALVMMVRYFSQEPELHSCVQRIIVSQVKSEGVIRNSTRSIIQSLHVPATPPTCLIDTIIQIAYQIEVEAKMKNFQGSQLISMPIIIGNVPLQCVERSVVEAQPKPNVESSLEDPGQEKNRPKIDGLKEKATSHGGDIHGTYPMFTNPPTYEQSVHTVRSSIITILDDESQRDFGPCGFTPLYPVFNIPSPSAPLPEWRRDDGHDNKTFQSV